MPSAICLLPTSFSHERRDRLADDLARRAFKSKVAPLRALPELAEAARAGALEGERLREQVNDIRRLHQTRLHARARLVVLVQLRVSLGVRRARAAHDVVEGRALGPAPRLRAVVFGDGARHVARARL